MTHVHRSIVKIAAYMRIEVVRDPKNPPSERASLESFSRAAAATVLAAEL